MTAQQLKNSILQMAVQGKLVPQDSNDEPASVLLERIKAEKQELIKSGKIKKDKKSSEIFRGASRNLPYAYCEQIGKEIRDISDEIPFEIPDSWEWVRLGMLAKLISDGTHKTPHYVDSGIPFLSVQNISKGYFDLTKIKYITEEEHQKLIERVKPQRNDILICRIGTLGKAIKITVDFEFSIFVSLGLIRLVDATLIDFIITAINSPLGLKWIDENKVGGGTHTYKINLVDLPNMLIPIPPLSEQHRIVAKIEELLPYIERYGKAEEHLTTLNTTFPEALKKSILQEAVQGKLVPQNPDDEPASVLLERIRAEKQKLIKAGKIKKKKPLAPITEEEIPFEIPDSWEWVRLSDVIDVRDGTHDTPSYVPEGYPLITGKDFYNGYFDFSKTKHISKEDYEEIIKRSKVDIGDILFSMIGGNIGSMIVITESNYIEMAIKNVALFKQYDYEISISEYLLIFLRSQISNMKAIAKGGAQSFVSLNILRSYPFPLPPLEEQKRIVAKIEELTKYCDKL